MAVYINNMANLLKIGKVIIIFLVIALVASVILEKKYSNTRIKLGVTFSPKYAKSLNLDWQKTYLHILDDLQVKNLRIPSYWDVLEPKLGEYDFQETDYLLNEASKRQVKVILVVGARQPRWPECHIPAWAKNLNVNDRQQTILAFIQQVVQKYKDRDEIWAWQIENEPLLEAFGEGCDPPDKKFLKSEVDLVRSLSNKKTILTDSGELGFWVTSMQLSDVFGTTLYRQVYDRYIGYLTYPFPPSFYSLKSSLIRKVFAKPNQKTIIVELQAEPWLVNGFMTPIDQQAKLFTAENTKNNLNFARQTGIDEVYLWGVEWWYFMAEHGYPEYLEYAKTLFR